MLTDTTTIAGKEVTLAYCYATEIAYKELTDTDIADFIPTIEQAFKTNRLPDIKATTSLIMSAHMAYMQAQGKDTADDITFNDFVCDATPTEIATALGKVLVLYAKFYHIPLGEPADKPDASEKNA